MTGVNPVTGNQRRGARRLAGHFRSAARRYRGGKARLLLGQEFRHGVFDARRGLHSEALAMLAGTLQAGSWLILLLPPESQWQTRPDEDSLRWNDGGQMIPAPHFMRHFARTLIHPAHLCRYEDQPFDMTPLPPQNAWQPPDGTPTPRSSRY